ncbi:MAG: Hsp70 family protein [Kiritimatiellae bacterium]|nr:Hsp70 family protein [Kiritimatiellia bacterium]
MARQTIDFGIDLGTTNSAIAVLNGLKPEIVKGNGDLDVTSSAVYIGRGGRLVVGRQAKNRLENAVAAWDVYTEFKRDMGSNKVYRFKTAGCEKTPVELSAEVLKELKGNVQQRLNEDVPAAVITIPAAFTQAQCVATREAAELAGFAQCPLLQEPVAASLAYGFQGDMNARDMWMVFDFGGGTFDAAIMKAVEGELQVVAHGGDNFLGGSDIDFGIIEQILVPELRNSFNLEGFRRGNERWHVAFSRMKRAVEEAKIELSRKEKCPIENCVFEDADGESVDFDELGIVLTRDKVIHVVEPLIERAASRCKVVLEKAGVDPSGISRILLVGGPTLAPYFREILQAKMDAPLDFSVDPLTVVACGAAIFAGTQRLVHVSNEIPVGGNGMECVLDLHYNPQGPDDDPLVSGLAAFPDGSLASATIEFINRTTKWTSGKIALDDNGQFRTRLRAEKGFKNVFDIVLTNSVGDKIPTTPDSIAYVIGMGLAGGQIVTNALSIALSENRVQVIVPSKTPYPFKKTCYELKTVTCCRKGTNERIEIPVLEGLNGDAGQKADHNRKLGSLIISGEQVARDVPSGADVEITLSAQSPGTLTATAYIPMLDQEYTAAIAFDGDPPSVEELKEQLRKERKHFEEAQGADPSLSKLLDDIEEKLGGAHDGVVARQCEQRLIETRILLDELSKDSQLPQRIQQVEDMMEDLSGMIAQHGTNADKQEFAQFIRQWADVHRSGEAHAVQQFDEDLRMFGRRVLADMPSFWVEWFMNLESRREEMRESRVADMLVAQGNRFIDSHNLDGLKRVVGNLCELLPQDTSDERGFNGTLARWK